MPRLHPPLTVTEPQMVDRPISPVMTCSRSEAAAFLSISPRTFDRIQEARAIPYVVIGRRRRYLLSDLDNFLKANRHI